MKQPSIRTGMLVLLCAVAPVCLFGFIGCSRARDPWASAKPEQKHVLASFTPLYCFAQNVAGEHALVLCLTTAEGPHDYRGTHTDALKVAGADLYLHNGLGLDDEASAKLLSMANKKSAVREVKVGDEIPHELLEHNHEVETKDANAEGHHHHHGDHDPHVWLGLEQARAMVDVIEQELAKLDPAHKDDFKRNAAAYKKELDKLEADGKAKFQGLKNRSMITMHESLAYVAKTFDLKVVGAMMEQAAHAPDAGTLTRLAKLGAEKQVRVIAIEPQYRTGAANELAGALRRRMKTVEVIEIDPIETAQPVDGSNPSPGFYLRRMRQNIDDLAAALRNTQ
jgi:zinc transport system substrate-binding protein